MAGIGGIGMALGVAFPLAKSWPGPASACAKWVAAMGAYPCGAEVAQSLTLGATEVVLQDGTRLPFHAAHLG